FVELFVFRSLSQPRHALFPYTTLFRSPVPRLERRERERHPVLLGGCPCLPNGDSGPSAAASCPRPRPGPMVQNTTAGRSNFVIQDRKSTRLNSSHVKNSFAVFCLIKKK